MIENIDPKDWYNVKFLNYIPPHFVKLKFTYHDKRIEVLEWLQTNTTGRFAIASECIELSSIKDPNKHQNWIRKQPARFSASTNFVEIHYIAFEEPAEATMFAMFFK